MVVVVLWGGMNDAQEEMRDGKHGRRYVFHDGEVVE